MKYAKIYKGNCNHWTGCLIHIAVMSRPDLSYAVMRLSGYNTSPTPATFHALNHLLCHIYHPPYLPLIYRSGTNKDNHQSYTVKGHAKILNPDKYQGLMTYTDADLARDLRCRRSVSSNVVEYNGTAVAWGLYKQTVPGTYTNITKTTSIYKGVKRTLEIRVFPAQRQF